MAEEGDEYRNIHGSPTLEDLGLRSRPTVQDSVVGKVRSCSDINRLEVAFLVLSIIAIVSAAALTVVRLTEITVSDGDFPFCIVLLINSAFCFYYILHGIFRERPHEMAVFLFSVGIIIVYIVANYITGTRNDIKLARMIAIVVVGVVAVALGCKIALEYFLSKNLIFLTVGANTELQAICQRVFLFQGLLKLDLQLELSVLVFIIVKQLDTIEVIILAVGCPIALGWFLLGSYIPRYEKTLMMCFFWALSWAEPAYVVYRIYLASKDLSDKDTLALSAVSIAACAIAIVVRIGLIAMSVAVFKAFGKGFKEKVFRKS